MGSNSNRSLTEEEKLGKYTEEVIRIKDVSSSEFQIKTGAKIRGLLGVEKGNAYIKAIKDATER